MTSGYGIPPIAYQYGAGKKAKVGSGYFGGYETIDYWLDEWLRIYPDTKKLGLSRNDWLVLVAESRDPARVLRELDTWVSTGYITEEQHGSIWGAVDWMGRQATAQFVYGELDPGDRERRLAEQAKVKEQERLGKLAREGQFFAPTPARPKPFTEYGPALEEMRAEFAGEMPKTERWRDWFRSKYPRLIERFEAKVPEKERRPKTWVEYLEKEKPEIREEWHGLGWYERGERPGVHAPRIQTVKFP